jgi:hypothetical protein
MERNGKSPQHTESKQSDAAKKKQQRGLIPFVKGDSRINRRGRPKSFDQFRAMAQQLGQQIIEIDGHKITLAEHILRQWAESKEPQLQKAFIEYAFGKVPDKVFASGLEGKTTLILHYGHQREQRDRDHQRLSAGISPSAD